MEFKKHIAILGTSPGSLRDCPFDRDDWELWGLSERPDQVPRFTAWFELHNLERKRRKSDAYWQQLKAMDVPLFTAHAHPDLPNARLFPKDEICARFGTYFSNTISWLIAYALAQEPDTIGLWGVDMAQDTEYCQQRPSCEYFLGWAMGVAEARGKPKIIIPPESDLLKCRRLYGFDDAGDRMAAKHAQRNRELAERLTAQEAGYEQADRASNMLIGAIQELTTLSQNGCPDALREQLASKIDELRGELQQAVTSKQAYDRGINQIKGAQENQRWVKQGF